MKIEQKKLIMIGVFAVAMLGIGFLTGVQYQKGKKTSSGVAAAANGAPNGSGFGGRTGRPGGRLGAFGAVKAVSDTSITVSNTRTNTDQTFAIDSSTAVTDGGAASTVSAIKVGDNVAIRASSSDATKATTIVLNPQVPSGGGFGPGAGAPTNSTPSTSAN